MNTITTYKTHLQRMQKLKGSGPAICASTAWSRACELGASASFASSVVSSGNSVDLLRKDRLQAMVVEAHRHGLSSTFTSLKEAVAVKDIRVCHGGVTWELEGTINETLLTDLFELDRRLLRRPSALCLVTPGKVMVVAKLDRKVLMYVCPGKIKVVREMDELLQKVIEETGDGHDITYTLSVLFAKPDVPDPEDDDALESQPLADGKTPPACSSRNPKLGTEYDNQPARMDSTALRTSVSRQHNNQMIGQSDDELKSISADMSTGDAKLILRPDGESSNVPDGCQHDDDDDSEARQQVKVAHFLQPTTTSTVVENTAAALSPPQRDELPIAEAYPDFKLPLTSVECTRSSAFGNPDKPSSPTMKDDNNNTSGCAASARASSTSVVMQLDNARLQTTPRHSGDTPCNNNMSPSPRLPPLALLDNVVVDPSRHHDHNNRDDCYATDNNNPSTQRTPELVETATATTSPARPFVARPPVVTIISHSKSTVHEAPTTYKAKLGEAIWWRLDDQARRVGCREARPTLRLKRSMSVMAKQLPLAMVPRTTASGDETTPLPLSNKDMYHLDSQKEPGFAIGATSALSPSTAPVDTDAASSKQEPSDKPSSFTGLLLEETPSLSPKSRPQARQPSIAQDSVAPRHSSYSRIYPHDVTLDTDVVARTLMQGEVSPSPIPMMQPPLPSMDGDRQGPLVASLHENLAQPSTNYIVTPCMMDDDDDVVSVASGTSNGDDVGDPLDHRHATSSDVVRPLSSPASTATMSHPFEEMNVNKSRDGVSDCRQGSPPLPGDNVIPLDPHDLVDVVSTLTCSHDTFNDVIQSTLELSDPIDFGIAGTLDTKGQCSPTSHHSLVTFDNVSDHQTLSVRKDPAPLRTTNLIVSRTGRNAIDLTKCDDLLLPHHIVDLAPSAPCRELAVCVDPRDKPSKPYTPDVLSVGTLNPPPSRSAVQVYLPMGLSLLPAQPNAQAKPEPSPPRANASNDGSKRHMSAKSTVNVTPESPTLAYMPTFMRGNAWTASTTSRVLQPCDGPPNGCRSSSSMAPRRSQQPSVAKPPAAMAIYLRSQQQVIDDDIGHEFTSASTPQLSRETSPVATVQTKPASQAKSSIELHPTQDEIGSKQWATSVVSKATTLQPPSPQSPPSIIVGRHAVVDSPPPSPPPSPPRKQQSMFVHVVDSPKDRAAKLMELREKKLKQLQERKEWGKPKEGVVPAITTTNAKPMVGQYLKPTSNRQLIQNALETNLLAGTACESERVRVVQALVDHQAADNFVVTFKGSVQEMKMTFKGLYALEKDYVHKIYGQGPAHLQPTMVKQFFRYNSGKKAFLPVSTRSFTIKTDGAALSDECFKKKKLDLF